MDSIPQARPASSVFGCQSGREHDYLSSGEATLSLLDIFQEVKLKARFMILTFDPVCRVRLQTFARQAAEIMHCYSGHSMVSCENSVLAMQALYGVPQRL